jgi:ribosomal-protein-alanine N-acetyltransferase
MNITTERLTLKLESLEEARAGVAGLPVEIKVQLSTEWLALLESATEADPWVLGFSIVRRSDAAIVGTCGFKGPPSTEGVAEIAYGVEPDEQGNGYATEATNAITEWAFQNREVRTVRAHTLPETNASTRVLTKCGFTHTGEVIDPDDGPVWRWVKERQ